MATDGVFRWVEGDAEYLDPGLVAETAGSQIARQMFEGLLGIAAGNPPPVPGQAERWEMSPDGLTYTLYLRPGLTWSDGVPITAEDFREVDRGSSSSRPTTSIEFPEKASRFSVGEKATLRTPSVSHFLTRDPDATSQTHIVRPTLATSNPPPVLSATAKPLWYPGAFIVCTSFPVAESHTLTTPSLDDAATRTPSGE